MVFCSDAVALSFRRKFPPNFDFNSKSGWKVKPKKRIEFSGNSPFYCHWKSISRLAFLSAVALEPENPPERPPPTPPPPQKSPVSRAVNLYNVNPLISAASTYVFKDTTQY